MSANSIPHDKPRPLRALAWDTAWNALRARYSALSARIDLGIATELDLAERDAIRQTMDQLIDVIR